MDKNVKLTLIEQALQSNYSRNKLDKVSLRQFVNRLLLLTQESRIFLFYKKHEKGGGWVYSFSTHGDVLYECQFKEQVISKLHTKRGKDLYYKKPESGKSIWPDEPQKIGDTHFGIILVAIEPKIIDEGRDITFMSPIDYGIKSNRIGNNEYEQLEKLWKNFLGSEFSKTLGVEARLRKRLEQIDKNPSVERNQLNIQHEKIDLSVSVNDRAFINRQLGHLSGIINEAYNDICETPLLCNQGKIPPNIFFFLRYYDEPETINRFKNGLGFCDNEPYPYSLKIIIPETQKRHLLSALKSIGKSLEEDDQSGFGSIKKMWRYYYKRLPGYNRLFPDRVFESNSCYPVEKLDFEFWQRIRMGQFEEILEDIQKPFTKEARSFVDPALMTGFTHFRSGVYRESGLERVTEAAEQEGFNSLDIRRLVYLHYLFSAAAPDSNYDNLGTMTVPLNVANQPYIALVRATVTKDRNEPNYRDNISWPQNFHFFTDVAQHCMRKLRDQSKPKYKYEVERIIWKEFKSALEISESNGIFINFRETEKRINKKLLLLCRVWPYPLISVTITSEMIKSHDAFIPIINAIDPKTCIFFSIKDNPYFCANSEHELSLMEKSDKVFITSEELKLVFKRALRRLEELITVKILQSNQGNKLN